MVKHLLAEGHRVRAMVRSESQVAALEEQGVEVVLADLADGESLRRAVDGVKGVYHIASIFRQSALSEEVFHDINAEGTRRLLDAAIDAGVERVIHCSTVGVHGHVKNPPANEEAPYAPGDMYQRTKLDGEKIALEYFRSGKIRGAVIRPAMIYGPTDTRTRKLIGMVAKGKFFYVGKGKALVHWIDVRDLVTAFFLAMQNDERTGEVYIISGKRAMPLKEMCEIIASKCEIAPPKLHLPVKPMQWLGTICETICRPINIEPPIFRRRVDFFTKDRHFDSSKAHAQLGFVPAQDPEQEIEDILASYRELGWI